jgi:hypothetical protein
MPENRGGGNAEMAQGRHKFANFVSQLAGATLFVERA